MDQTLYLLERQLEKKAIEARKNYKKKILVCKYCRRKPEHTYDSFGMPMHYLKCPKCEREASYPKEYEGIVREWNKMNKPRKK